MPRKKPDPPPPKQTPKGTYRAFASPEYREVEEFTKDYVRIVLGTVMRRRKLTATQVGLIMGLSPSAVKKRMGGQVEFSVSELVALSRCLGIDPRVFYDPSGPTEQIVRSSEGRGSSR